MKPDVTLQRQVCGKKTFYISRPLCYSELDELSWAFRRMHNGVTNFLYFLYPPLRNITKVSNFTVGTHVIHNEKFLQGVLSVWFCTMGWETSELIIKVIKLCGHTGWRCRNVSNSLCACEDLWPFSCNLVFSVWYSHCCNIIVIILLSNNIGVTSASS